MKPGNRASFLLAALALTSIGVVQGSGQKFQIKTYTLKNGIKIINALTLVEAQRVTKQYFPRNTLVFVLSGKANEIESVANKYAPKLDSKSISQPGSCKERRI